MNRLLPFVGSLCLLSAALCSTGCVGVPKAVTHGVCPDCGLRVCSGCKHAPDPGTSGYHCTTWFPMGDPCLPPPYFHPPAADEGPAPVVSPDGAPLDYSRPEPLPPVDDESP